MEKERLVQLRLAAMAFVKVSHNAKEEKEKAGLLAMASACGDAAEELLAIAQGNRLPLQVTAVAQQSSVSGKISLSFKRGDRELTMTLSEWEIRSSLLPHITLSEAQFTANVLMEMIHHIFTEVPQQ